MNKARTTKERIEWTSEGLNTFLPVYKDIEDLQIVKRDRGMVFVKGTAEDTRALLAYITGKFVGQRLRTAREWDPSFWYEQDQPDLADKKIPSHYVEKSFRHVVDVYLRHQHGWDTTQQVEVVDFNESESESDSDDERDPF